MNMWNLVSVDTGGTFTDLIAITGNGVIKVIKEPSSPEFPEKAIVSALQKLGGKCGELIHGTTVAINALLQRKGAKVALITTRGFADILEIGRQARTDIYDHVPSRPTPLVTSHYRLEVDERVLHSGKIEKKINEADLEQLVKTIKQLDGVEAIAVCLLFSFVTPEHENMILKQLESMDIPISLSSYVSPEYREYERTSTTVMDAYIKPLTTVYLSNLIKSLKSNNLANNLAIMKSSKGLSTPDGLVRKPVEILVSGLAGGVQAGELTSRILSIGNIITLDIGGTSTDVSQITKGSVSQQHSFSVDGLPISIASVDVKTIGAGGGSIAQCSGRILRVGPESAGASPGPACYGNGGNLVTVTDADLYYGLLPSSLGGGEIELDHKLAEIALIELSEQLGVDIDRTVEGIRSVFHENIAGAIRNVTTERGVDPRDYTLLAFGGAGAVHGCELASIMGIDNVIIPPYPGIWSAVGLLGADYRYDVSRGLIAPLGSIDTKNIENILNELHGDITSMSSEDGIDKIAPVEFIDQLAMRYVGQSFELNVVWTGDMDELHSDFIALHTQEYGFAAPDEPVEVVSIRVSAIIAHPDPQLPLIAERPQAEPYTVRIVGGNKIDIYNREDLGKGFTMTGPVIIDQLDSTCYIPKGWKMKLDDYGFIHARRNS